MNTLCKKCGKEKTGIDKSRNNSMYCRPCKYANKVSLRKGLHRPFESLAERETNREIILEYQREVKILEQLETLWSKHPEVFKFERLKRQRIYHQRIGPARIWKERTGAFGKYFIKRSVRKMIYGIFRENLLYSYAQLRRYGFETPALIKFSIENLRDKLDSKKLKPFPILKMHNNWTLMPKL